MLRAYRRRVYDKGKASMTLGAVRNTQQPSGVLERLTLRAQNLTKQPKLPKEGTI